MSGFVKIAMEDYYSDSNWTTIISKYWTAAEKVSDPRVQGWFLFDTPLLTLAMVITYLSFVMVIGPQLMNNRKPVKCKNTLVAYNAFQVLLSGYMFYEHLMAGWWRDYSLSCQPVDYSDSDKARRMLHLCWVYYFSKLSEFADTVFFVLRKKKSQITWLHLYHHSLTPFEAWVLVKFIAGGHGTFSNIVNNLVHVIMYSYYMVSAMGPEYNKYLWWKKHLTTLQLIQFFMVLFHSISALVCDCGYPKIIAAGLILHSSIFIVLFMNFYIQSYKRRSQLSLAAAKANGHVANGHVSSDNTEGHAIVENNNFLNGHAIKENGHAIKENGYAVKENGHAIKENGYALKENGNLVKQNGHAIKVNGHAIKENGHLNGHVIKRFENGNIANGGHAVNGHCYSNGHVTTLKEEKQKTH